MKSRRHAYALLATGLTASVLAVNAGVAHAQPDPSVPVGPSVIDQLITEGPELSVDPTDEGGPTEQWGGAGMYCLNMSVRCR